MVILFFAPRITPLRDVPDFAEAFANGLSTLTRAHSATRLVQLRIKGLQVRVLPGAPANQGLSAKLKSRDPAK